MTADSATSPTTFTNARRNDGTIVDIEISNGVISAVTESQNTRQSDSADIVDLDNMLLLPAMAEPHAHLDKALTAERVPNPTGDLMGAIDAWVAAARRGEFTHDDIVERAIAGMEKLVISGVTAVRTHVNVGGATGASSVVALEEAAAEMDGVLDVQIVALTHSPMAGPDGADNRSGLDAAVDAGAHLVGGCPHLEYDLANGPAMITHAIEVAAANGLDIDLHVDETLDASVLFLEELARQIIDTGFSGNVAASHCVTLGLQPPEVQERVSALVAEAGISVFALPQTNLFLQGREQPVATPRGLTAVGALNRAGANVAAGADNVQDPFNLVGRSDPLETAALMVMAGHQLPDDAYDMVANRARRGMGLPPITFSLGDPADFVAIDAPSIRGAIADAPMTRRTFRRGVEVASTSQTTSVRR